MKEHMIFETHAHYDDKQFDQDRENLLCSMQENGIETILNAGSSIEACRSIIVLTEQYEFLYGALGVHPSDITDLQEVDYEWLREKTKLPKIVAVGEIGLDYYWDKEEKVQKNQRYWFRRQLDLARERSLPVIIHSREAAQDTLRLMKEAHAEQIPGVVHCFSYSLEMALEYIKMGYYIGIGGVITFKNARKLKEAAANIPLERILLETDSPYLAPEPNRGTRNSSLNLKYIAGAIADIRNISVEEVIDTTRENARTLFEKISQ